MSHAIEATALTVRYGTRDAASDVSLAVDFGEIVVLLGPNGAGKTTTVDTVLGFRSPSSGRVRVVGLDPVRDHAKVVTTTGALLQRGGVWAPMSPRDVLTLTASYYPAPRSVAELVDQLGLAACARRSWRRLSGGEQQRTLLALALVGRPRVLVLDEPTAAVDPEGHHLVRTLLAEERRQGRALLVTTHDLSDAAALADRLVILDHGRVVATGTTAELAGPAALVVECSVDLDPDELGRRLGAPVTVVSPRVFRCPVAASPAHVAAVNGYVDECGGRVLALRTADTLEEAYLRLLTADRERVAP